MSHRRLGHILTFLECSLGLPGQSQGLKLPLWQLIHSTAQHRHVHPEVSLVAFFLSSSLRHCTWDPLRKLPHETGACWTVVHSPAQGVISGLVSHYTSVRAGLLVNLDSVKIIINMFESIYCCVVSFHPDHGRYPRAQRETAVCGKGLRLSSGPGAA